MPFATPDSNTSLQSPSASQPSSIDGYYANTRPEVQSLVNPAARRILDIGCGEGSMAAELKLRRDAEVWGVEYVAAAAEKARHKLDTVLCGDIQTLLPHLPDAWFDVIVCADVLEHLADPWYVLGELRHKLAPGGELVASIPNVRFWSVVRDLLEGRWDYTEFGILDRTHLRFFTFDSVAKLFTGAGFTIADIQANVTDRANGIPESIVRALAAEGLQVSTLAQESCHFQYLIIARSLVQGRSSADTGDNRSVNYLNDADRPAHSDTPSITIRGIAPMTADEINNRIAQFPYWYHRIELPHGIVTPGWAPLDVDSYRIPADLSGKRVLDVGAWDGFWTFEALKRGAAQVVAIDDFSDYLGSLPTESRKAWQTFDTCREILGYSEDQCPRYDMSVYDVSEELLGTFDVVFCFGTLYHLRHPLLALDKLSAVCKEEIFVESAILDDYSPYRGGINQGYAGGQMVMEFYPQKQYGDNDTNWWAPTLSCLGYMVRAAGFTKAEGWKLVPSPTHLTQCRGFIHGKK